MLLMVMHEGEVHVDAELVTALVADQFPHLADLPVRSISSTGTVNAVFRIGERLCARLPRVEAWATDLEREWETLQRLESKVSIPVPERVAQGRATSRYPFTWAIYGWIAGEPYDDQLVQDEGRAALDLARFVVELRSVDVRGAPPGGRRPLRELDRSTTAAIRDSGSLIDADEACAVWERALEAPAWNGAPVWIHADLLRPNILVTGGQVAAIIDFGSAGVGDPAADVIAAWSVFGPAGRAVFREALDVDDQTWLRACGFALHQAAMIIPYYGVTNPRFVAMARRTIDEIIADMRP